MQFDSTLLTDLHQGCQTANPSARCGGEPKFMWPSKASRIQWVLHTYMN